DAFTTQAFRGNPAAVCLLQHELHDDLYQKIAAEMNLSETAFIWTLNSSDDFSSGVRFGLRWFTPKNEIPLCGHATIASAAVLFYHKKNVNPSVTFETLSGELYVRMHEEAIVMDFPQNKPTPQIAVGDLPVADVQHCGAIKALMVRLSDHCDRTALTSLQPDPEALLHAESSGRIKSIIVTMKGDPSSKPAYDFISRNFAPWHGIPEDPVTGSAHTILGSYWSEKLDKKKMLAYQCSSRGGELTLNLKDDGRVDIAGRAVTVLKGMLILPL
ncbi:Phenazine biosynthesis-like domain-containing protein 2-like, partial [Scleropages formosus]